MTREMMVTSVSAVRWWTTRRRRTDQRLTAVHTLSTVSCPLSRWRPLLAGMLPCTTSSDVCRGTAAPVYVVRVASAVERRRRNDHRGGPRAVYILRRLGNDASTRTHLFWAVMKQEVVDRWSFAVLSSRGQRWRQISDRWSDQNAAKRSSPRAVERRCLDPA